MKLLVLYEELSGYFMASIHSFAVLYKADVLILHKNQNDVAPFEFAAYTQLRKVNRDRMTKEEILDMVKAFDADAVFCAGWSCPLYLELVERTKTNVPVVLGFDNWWSGTLKQRIKVLIKKKYIRQHFNACFVPGQPQKEFAHRLGFGDKEIATGAYCCDLGRFNTYYQDNRSLKEMAFPKRFIFTGRYEVEKGLHLLLKVFSELKTEQANEWELWCLGKGSLKFSENKSVRHLGFIQPDKMNDVIANCGVFVLPSRFEPWGVAVHEFAAAGFPLLLSDQVGATESFLIDGNNGYLCKSENESDLKNKLRKMMALSDAELNEMGNRSNQLANKITPEIWTRTLYKLMVH